MKLRELTTGKKRMAGVEIRVTEQGVVGYYCMTECLGNQINKVRFGSTEEQEFKRSMLQNIPVTVTVTGKGVIFRKVPSLTNINSEKLAQQVFPNAFGEDYYIQSITSNEEKSWVLLARKNVIDEAISNIFKSNLLPTSLLLGPAGALPVIDHRIITFPCKLPGYKLSGENSLIDDIIPIDLCEEDTDTLVGDIKIPSNFKTSFSASLFPLTKMEGFTSFETEKFNLSFSEYIQRKTFRRLIRFTVLFLSLLFGLNYFIKVTLSENQHTLEAQLKGSDKYLKQVDSLKKKIKEQDLLFKETGWSSQSRISWYADQIASTIKGSLQLKKMTLNPLNPSLNQKKMKFIAKTILLNGTADRGSEVNNFAKELKSLPWIKEVKISSYENTRNSIKGEFIINLTIK